MWVEQIRTEEVAAPVYQVENMTIRDVGDEEATRAAFDDEGVRYVLVGGYAVSLHNRPRSTKDVEFWIDGTCFAIWEPESQGMPFAPQKNAHLALHVDDVAVVDYVSWANDEIKASYLGI